MDPTGVDILDKAGLLLGSNSINLETDSCQQIGVFDKPC